MFAACAPSPYQYFGQPYSYDFPELTAAILGLIGAAYILIAGLKLRAARALRARQPDAVVPDTGARFFLAFGAGLFVYPFLYSFTRDGGVDACNNMMLFKLLLYFCTPVPWLLMARRKFAHCWQQTWRQLWLTLAIPILVIALGILAELLVHNFKDR